METEVRELHPQNARLPISATPDGRDTDSSDLQFSNADRPSEDTEEGMDRETRDVQFINDCSPIDVAACDKITEDSLAQSMKRFAEMMLAERIDADCRLLQPANAE